MDKDSGQPAKIVAAPCASARSTMATEELLSEETESPKLRLKNSAEVEARAAYVHWKMLEAMQRNYARHLFAMLALARGNEASITPDGLEELKNRYPSWFEQNGKLNSVAQNVLLSAFRDSPDGPVLVNPFQLTCQAECDLLDTIEHQTDRLLRRLLRDGSGPQQRNP